jgi:hypothetical protein
MKQIVFSILIFLFLSVFLIGCASMKKPDIDKDYTGFTDTEKKMQYEYDMCCYAQQFSKIDLKCDNIKDRNKKVNMILLYNTLKNTDALPIIYRKTGEEIMTFDDFNKYIQ